MNDDLIKIHFPGFNKFYSLSRSLDFRMSFIGSATTSDDDKIDDYKIKKGMIFPPPSISIAYHEGAPEPGDLLWTTELFLGPIISEKLLSHFQREGFTGFRPYQVMVQDKEGKKDNRYYGLSIFGRCGRPDYSSLPKVFVLPPTPKGKPKEFYIGTYFDPNSWDGSDFFIPDTTARQFITERVRDALTAYHFNNVKIINITEDRTPAITVAMKQKRERET